MENKIYSAANADEVKVGTYGIFSDDRGLYEKIDLTKETDRNHIKKLKEICHDGNYCRFEAFKTENNITYRFFKPVFSLVNEDSYRHYMSDGSVKDKDGNIYDFNTDEKPDWLNERYTKVLLSDVVEIHKNVDTKKQKDEYHNETFSKDKHEDEDCINTLIDNYHESVVRLIDLFKGCNFDKFLTCEKINDQWYKKAPYTHGSFCLFEMFKISKDLKVDTYMKSYKSLIKFDCFTKQYNRIIDKLKYDIELLYKWIPNDELKMYEIESLQDIVNNCGDFYILNSIVQKLLLT